MTLKDFENGLASGRLENYYFFIGPEEQLKKRALERLRALLLPAGLEALNEVSLEDCDASKIIDNAILLPVMCDRRIVIVRDWKPFLASKSGKESDSPSASKAKKPEDQMKAWLEQAPDSCVIVFYFTKPEKKSIAKEKNCVAFDFLSGNALREECDRILAPFGKTIKPDAFNELTLMAGQDLTRLSTELNKLAAYTARSKSVTLDDVRAVATPSPEYSVFSILDRLLENNIAEATRVLNSLLKQSDNSPTRVVSLFISSIRVYLLLKLAADDNRDLTEVSRTLGVSDARRNYVVRKFKFVSAESLRVRYDACIAAELSIKSGAARERAALDALMLKILLPPTATSRANRSSY